METGREAGVAEAEELFGLTGAEPLAVTETNDAQIPQRKTCPILKAGTMQEKLFNSFGKAQYISHESAYCIGPECAWYEHGCPAYPGK